MPIAKRKNNTVERKILFYRIDAGTHSNGKPRAVSVGPILSAVNSLGFKTHDRYHESEPGLFTCCWVDRPDSPPRVRVGNVRRAGLPLLESGGNLSPLSIADDEGLVEQTHVVFFPDRVVGADFNFFGPRLSRLATYFREKHATSIPLRFNPLLRRDAWDQVERLTEFRKIELKIRASYAETIRRADADLGSAFEAAHRATSADTVEITFTVKPYSRSWLGERAAQVLKRLKSLPDLHEGATGFSVTGYNDEAKRMETIDLLNDKLVARREVVREGKNGRTLKPKSVFEAIEAAYADLAEDIQRALEVVSE